MVQQPTQPTPNAPSVFAADLSDAQVREQIAAVGGNVNMDIKQARAIIHNARIAAAVRAQEAAAEKAKAEAYANQLKHMDGSDRERLVQVAPGVWTRLGDYPQPGEKQQPVLNLDLSIYIRSMFATCIRFPVRTFGSTAMWSPFFNSDKSPTCSASSWASAPAQSTGK